MRPVPAFAAGSDHMHQNLHFSATWIEERTESLLHNRFRFDTSCDDFLDREFAARNHADHARPHRHLETPGRLDGDVLQRPQRGIHDRLFYVQARLHNSPVVAHRFDTDALLGAVADVFDDVDRSRIEQHGVNTEALDMLPTVGIGLTDEDLRRPHGITDQDDKRPDRPAARYENGAAAGHLRAIDAIKRHRSRFNERPLLIGDVVGKNVGVVVVNDCQLAHPAPGPTQPYAAHAGAQMVEAASAVVVVERHDEWLDRDSIAFVYSFHVAAGLDHLGRELVPQNLRQHCACKFMWTGWRNDWSTSEFVQVRAADTAC